MASLFPHQKLDWLIERLELQSRADPGDLELRLSYARALLSKGLFHDGGEQACSLALRQCQRVLRDEPMNAEALVLAGSALLGTSHMDGARSYLDEALLLAPERADLHLALGALERASGDRKRATLHFEQATRLAPEAWEPHYFHGRLLLESVLGGPAPPEPERSRLIERAQVHLVRALKQGLPPDLQPPALRDLGQSCLLSGRYAAAERIFLRLREHPRFHARARLHLGQVAYALGKYKNAVHHLRAHLEEQPHDAAAWVTMARAHLQLGEYDRAREACNRALLVKPDDTEARYVLGCTVLEEGDPQEALKQFRINLKAHPEHLPSYAEVARTRRLGGDAHWLLQALSTEVGVFDRLPPPSGGQDAREHTRERIAVLLDELRAMGPSAVRPVLDALQRTRHEGLRFQLWEAATALAAAQAANDVALKLREAGRHFSVALGRQAFTLALYLPDPVLTRGLSIDEDALKQAATERFPPAPDYSTHQSYLNRVRQVARAYQALLLLAIARRRTRAGRELLERWAETADPEMATVARVGLAAYGDPGSVAALRERARERELERALERLLERLAPPRGKIEPHPLREGETARCSSCGRASEEVHHLMVGGEAVLCDQCVHHIGRHRHELLAGDQAHCQLCGRTAFEATIFSYNGVQVCHHCLDLALGLLEREEVDAFLASW